MDYFFFLQNSSIASKIEAVVVEIVSAVNVQCRTQCRFTSEQIQNAGFRCIENDNIVVFRGELISTQQSSPSELRDYVQVWVRTAPQFLVENISLKVDPLCPTAIQTLRDPACDEDSPPSTGPTGGVVTPEFNTGATTAGWVIAALALFGVIILIVVGILRLLYLRHRRNKIKAET